MEPVLAAEGLGTQLLEAKHQGARQCRVENQEGKRQEAAALEEAVREEGPDQGVKGRSQVRGQEEHQEDQEGENQEEKICGLIDMTSIRFRLSSETISMGPKNRVKSRIRVRWSTHPGGAAPGGSIYWGGRFVCIGTPKRNHEF